MKLVIIIPTYNERENIITLLQELALALKDIHNHTISYLVVDDTSPDGTREVVEAYRKTHKNVYILIGEKEGLGKAILRGQTEAFEHMNADIVLQIDADLSHDPKIAPKFIKAIDSGYDFVVGSRYIRGGGIPDNWGLHRKIYSVLGNTIVRFGLGHLNVNDWTGGYRAYTRKFYEEIHNELTQYSGYVFQIAFLHKAIHHDAKILEIPFKFTDRLYGHSKIAPAEYIKNIFSYIFQSRFEEIATPQFGRFLVVGGVGFFINTLILEIIVRIGLHPSVGSVVGAEFAIISNFTLNNAWTFRHRKIHESKKFHKFLQFNTTSIGAILIQAGAVYLGTHLYGLDAYRPFYLVGVGIGLIWNYVMYSKVIWKKTA